MDANTTKVMLALVGVLVLVASGIAITVRIVMKQKNNTTRTKQSGNVVFGDQAGRDIKK